MKLIGAGLLGLAVVSACGGSSGPGVLVELHAPSDPGARPDWLWVYWRAPGGAVLEGRLPEQGTLPATGSRLGSLYVEVHGDREQARLLVVRGQRGQQVVCGGALSIDAAVAAASPRLQLGPPLSDQDGDGLPDVLERAPATAIDAGPGPSPGVDARDPTGLPDAAAPPPDAAMSPPDGAPDLPRPPTDLPVEPPLSPLRAELVAHWRFDDGAGSAVARDSSGHNNVGTLLGASIASGWIAGGRLGGALAVPAADGHGALVLPTASVAAITRAFTIAAWTRRSSNRGGGGSSTVLSRRAANSLDSHYFALAFTGDGRLRGSINTQVSPRPPVVTSAAAAPLDRWVHVAFSYDGARLRLFVDGAAAGSADYGGPVSNAGTPLCLGCAHNRPGHVDVDQSLGGSLDELLLYARALAPDEIARLASGELPSPP